jgi:hypothetical protein
MAEAYDRERQNNARLDELSAKVSALRGVTVDIYDHARAHEVIDSTVRFFAPVHPPLVPRSQSSNAPLILFLVRHIQLHDNTDQRLGRTTRAHGCIREQDRDSQTLRDNHWRGTGLVLFLPSLLLARPVWVWQRRQATAFCVWKRKVHTNTGDDARKHQDWSQRTLHKKR